MVNMKLWLTAFVTVIFLSGCYHNQFEYRPSEQLVYDEDGALTMRITYQYDFRGNLIKNIGYDNHNTAIFFTELVYNADGLLAEEIIKDTQYLNDIVSGEYDFITTYEYDADNKIKNHFIY
jgi:hypothetical protein